MPGSMLQARGVSLGLEFDPPRIEGIGAALEVIRAPLAIALWATMAALIRPRHASVGGHLMLMDT